MKRLWFIFFTVFLVGCSTVYSGDSQAEQKIKTYELDYLPNGDYITISSGSGGREDVYFKLKSSNKIHEPASTSYCYFFYIEDGVSYVEIIGEGHKAKYNFYINLNR